MLFFDSCHNFLSMPQVYINTNCNSWCHFCRRDTIYMTMFLLNSSPASIYLRMISGIADMSSGGDLYLSFISLKRLMYLSEESTDIPNFWICLGLHGMPSVRFISSSSMLSPPVSSLRLQFCVLNYWTRYKASLDGIRLTSGTGNNRFLSLSR